MSNEDWLALARSACEHAGVDAGVIEVLRTWDKTQNTVCRLSGGRYLKLYRHNAARQFAIERCVLPILERGGIPAPRLVAAAERAELPPYVIVTEVPGSAAEHAWERLSRTEQLAAAREFGAVTAAFHRLPQADFAAVERAVGGVRELIAFERSRRLDELREPATLPEPRRTLYDALPAKRDDLLRFIETEGAEHVAGPLRLTHGDLSNGHLYLSATTGGWRFSGVIDWAEAMLTPPEWDVIFLWFWTFSGDREAMKECLSTFYADTPRPPRLARRCFAASLYTYSWASLWHDRKAHFTARPSTSEPLDRQLIAFLFPPEVFGPPD